MLNQRVSEIGRMRKSRRDPVAFTQIIGPEQAQRMLAEMHYPHQRPLRKDHTQMLADAMRNGEFESLTQIRIAIHQNNHYVLDGQHRLHAIVLTGIPQAFTITEQEVTSWSALARIYGRVDRNRKRNDYDRYVAEEIAEACGLTRPYLVRNLGATIKYMATGCTRTGEILSNDSKLMLLYGPYIKMYEDILKSVKLSSHLMASMRRASTMAVALLTLRFSAPIAKKEIRPSVNNFWIGMLTDDGLRIGDPRKVVYRHLTEMRLADTTPAYSTRYIGQCFNAYIAEREIRSTRVLDEMGPLNLYGIPNDPAEWLK